MHRIFGGRRLDTGDLRHDGNAFTVARWLLAASVMISHAWDVTQPRPELDPTVLLLTHPVSWLAVSLFFTLSGFLVTGSLVTRGVRDFAVARALRLLPGLWAMLVVVILGLWLLFGTTSLRDYLFDPLTVQFALRNATAVINIAYFLPDMFTEQPFPGVNGSLWTIPQEVRCYIALALLGGIGVLGSRRWFAVAFVLATAIHLVLPAEFVPSLAEPRRLAFSFFLGVVGYQWRDRLWLSWRVAVVGAVAGLAVAHFTAPGTIADLALQLSFAYLTLVAAIDLPRAAKRFSARLPDYSYGIYIYAFPVQQSLVTLGWGTTPLANLGLGLAVTLLFAAPSWHLIERPALALKPRLTRRRPSKVSA